MSNWRLLACMSVGACGLNAKPMIEVDYGEDALIRSISRSHADTVCAGETVTVTVDSDAHVYVNRMPGPAAMFPAWPPETDGSIRVYAHTDDGFDEEHTFPLKVEDCGKDFVAVLASANPYPLYRVDFRVLATDDVLADATSFSWTFGDGSKATTNEPFISHDYRDHIDHGQRWTHFLASVKETASGLSSGRPIAVESYAQSALLSGFVHAEMGCRAGSDTADGSPPNDDGSGPGPLAGSGWGAFPGVGLPGTFPPGDAPAYEQQIRVRHFFNRDVEFDTVKRVEKSCDPDAPARWQDLTVYDVFGARPDLGIAAPPPPPAVPSDTVPGVITIQQETANPPRPSLTIAPGQEVTGVLERSWDAVAPDTCVVGYHLLGHVDDNPDMRAAGSCYFRIRVGPDDVAPITDLPTRKALAAFIASDPDKRLTTDELHALENQGVLRRTPDGWVKETP
ncbi:MAG: PKD domain-containing protein [Myxococcota bacterium]